jgi:hypothetical protein
MSVDWARAERWTNLLLDGRLAELQQVFAAHGARGPSIKWRPTGDELQWKPMKFALDRWTQAAADGVPTTRLVDPIEFAPALGYLLLVDVVDGGHDFTYRLFGSLVSAVSGFDMTRKNLSEHPASAYIREFSIALYRAAIIRREPAWSHYGPAMAVSTAAWERVVLPLTDEVGTIRRFLVATVPISIDGNVLKN